MMKKLSALIITFSFLFALVSFVKAQGTQENIETFFDSEIPGIKIQINATSETQPGKNITLLLSLEKRTSVYVEYFNLSVYGFLNGTERVLMANITDENFLLNDAPREYPRTFEVHEQVWGVTYCELRLSYNVTYNVGSGILVIIPYEDLTIGFTATNVENVYLKGLVDAYGQLNQTYWELHQNYTALQKNLGELDSTRQAAIALAVTTVFFVATTLFLVMRKPKQYW